VHLANAIYVMVVSHQTLLIYCLTSYFNSFTPPHPTLSNSLTLQSPIDTTVSHSFPTLHGRSLTMLSVQKPEEVYLSLIGFCFCSVFFFFCDKALGLSACLRYHCPYGVASSFHNVLACNVNSLFLLTAVFPSSQNLRFIEDKNVHSSWRWSKVYYFEREFVLVGTGWECESVSGWGWEFRGTLNILVMKPLLCLPMHNGFSFKKKKTNCRKYFLLFHYIHIKHAHKSKYKTTDLFTNLCKKKVERLLKAERKLRPSD
jgi:hypothetical protein